MSEDVWTFVSYAHDDNLPTGDGPDEEGFVSFLHRMLEVKLKDLGARDAKLWRDAKRFSNGDPYDVEIEDALKKSALLIVVMSRNWLERPYCLKELDEFVRFRKSNGIEAVQERIIVVGKQYVPKDRRPAVLQVQEGFPFFERDSQDDVAGEKPLFALGVACDKRFFAVRDDLAAHLHRRVLRISAGAATGTSLPPDVWIAAPNGRTVYLAKPAVDMEQAYNRFALELQGRGFSVVPDVNSNIPNTGARDYVDEALKASELSIHLLGEKHGFAPDEDDLPRIADLQLIRARERAAAAPDADGAKFRRVVWAPKALETGLGNGGGIGERDPITVLSHFDQQSPSDMVEGGVISKFLESLFQYLAATATRRAGAQVGDDVEVFLDFNPRDDDEYGLSIASALSDGPISVVVPASGEASEARAFNQSKLAKCEGVLLCWGAASEVWVRAEADRLFNWRDLGRTQQFARCSLVVGPPPAGRKKAANVLFRKNQFDKIVDLSDKGDPTGDLLTDVAQLKACAGSPA